MPGVVGGTEHVTVVHLFVVSRHREEHASELAVDSDFAFVILGDFEPVPVFCIEGSGGNHGQPFVFGDGLVGHRVEVDEIEISPIGI